MHAALYPIGKVWSESRLARSRINARIATDAVMTQTVIASVLGGGDALQELLQGLQSDD